MALRNLGAALLLFVLAGCAQLPFVKPAPQITSGQRGFPGILQRAAELGRSDVSVFVSHGMGETKPCFANEIATMLDGVKRKCKSADDAVGSWTDVCLGTMFRIKGEAMPDAAKRRPSGCPAAGEAPNGSMNLTGLGRLQVMETQASYGGRTFNVRIYGYFWNDDALAFQKPFLADDLDNGASDRTWLNRTIKKNTIDLGFSDAVLYIGRFGAVMRTGMRSALCLMALDAARPAGAPVSDVVDPSPCETLERRPEAMRDFGARHGALVSLSLGSRILFDALDNEDVAQPGRGAVGLLATALPENTPVFYMAANQLPLLGIGELQADPVVPGEAIVQHTPKPSFLTGYIAPNADKARERPDNLIVAFYDPNDLLGYRAGRHLSADVARHIVEVQQYYATRWFFFANPVAAHAQTYSDRTGSRMVRCGAVMTGGKLVVREPC